MSTEADSFASIIAVVNRSEFNSPLLILDMFESRAKGYAVTILV
jgi:hypothetical protein